MSKKALSAVWLEGGAAHGSNRQGKQRWHCRQCARTFIWRNPANRYQQRRGWFERWIMEGDTVRQLAAPSGYSPRTLHRIIAHWLHQPPPLAGEFSAARHLILDGPFLDRRKGVFAVMDAARFAVVDAAPDMAEGPAHLQPFCTTLAHHGFTPLQCDRRWQPALAPDLCARCGRRSSFNAVWSTSNGKASVGVASRPNVQTPGTGAPCFATSWRSAPWPSGIS